MTSLPPTETARILVEALPYIRQFAGKSVVVKLGGAAIDKDSDLALAQDVLLLRSVGVRCVLVHGGGPQVDVMLRRVGKEPQFVDGLRVPAADTLEIVRVVVVGRAGWRARVGGCLRSPRRARHWASSATSPRCAPNSSTGCSTTG